MTFTALRNSPRRPLPWPAGEGLPAWGVSRGKAGKWGTRDRRDDIPGLGEHESRINHPAVPGHALMSGSVGYSVKTTDAFAAAVSLSAMHETSGTPCVCRGSRRVDSCLAEEVGDVCR